MSWHGQALDDAFAASLNERDALTRDERIEWERQAQQFREAGAELTVEAETLGSPASEGREEQR
ncbi:hypothetical protein [Micromonospora sp. NPDC047187]|uniref:hypothetical protein n=1 Tax=Micromonospora sp. NPDC047187 TaxID=3155262 RepID=UPI0033F54A7E